MGSASSMMAVAMGVQSANSAASAYNQSQALKTQGEYQSQQANANARISEIKAKDAIERGQKDSNALRKKSNQFIGSQRVAAAASGADVDKGVSLELQTEAKVMSELDMMTITNNAWREAWGYRVEANDTRGQGRFAQMAAKSEAKQTMLTGGLQALSYGAQSAYHYKRGQKVDDVIASLGNKNGSNDIVKNEKERIIAERTKSRSKQNPLYADRQLDTSWWVRYT